MIVTIEVLKNSASVCKGLMLKWNCNTIVICHFFSQPIWFSKFHLQSEARFRQQLSLCFKYVYFIDVILFYLKASFINDSFLTE
jgi:hypothetical protein